MTFAISPQLQLEQCWFFRPFLFVFRHSSEDGEKMKLLRTSSLLWLATLVSHGWAISLLEVLQSYPQLSSLYTLVNSSSKATALLANANNFTFLAPSNDAISKFNGNPGVLNGTQLLPNIQYGLLKGGYPALSISSTPQFIQSNLSDSTYANVTEGQAVELVLGSDGAPEAITGNRSISTSSGSVSPKSPSLRTSVDNGNRIFPASVASSV
jgi:hypothetical protein